jgi:hypothetical protein
MRKLNIGAVIRAVFGVVSDIGLVSRAGGVWFAALIVIRLIELAAGTVDSIALQLMFAAIATIPLACCAVNIHRFILLSERPAPARLGRFVAGLAHGTTVATNALLQGEIDSLGLIVTSGFRHILETARRCRAGLTLRQAQGEDVIGSG